MRPTRNDCDKETSDPRVHKGYDGPTEAAMPCDAKAYRESGRGILHDRINRLRQRAADLEAISNALPVELTPDQDQALWNIAASLRLE